MGRLGLPELLVILAIIVIGANRLPGLGRGIGDAIRVQGRASEARRGRQERQEPQEAS
jgi:Sec-independent protein translocase protein TatA